jgi:hypothetical protein
MCPATRNSPEKMQARPAMRIGTTAVKLALHFFLMGAAKARHYPLPPSAVITIGQLPI